jgi:hypothetical protein
VVNLPGATFGLIEDIRTGERGILTVLASW